MAACAQESLVFLLHDISYMQGLCPARSPESRMVLVSSRLLEIKFMTLLPQDLSKSPWGGGMGDGWGCCNPSPRDRPVLSIRPEAWQGRQGVDVGARAVGLGELQ